MPVVRSSDGESVMVTPRARAVEHQRLAELARGRPRRAADGAGVAVP